MISVGVISLLDLPSDPNTGRDAYAIGLLIIFFVTEAGTVIYRVVKKRTEKTPPIEEEN